MAAFGPAVPDDELPLPLLLELPTLPPEPLPEPLPLDTVPPEDDDAATCPPASPPWTVLVLPPQPAGRESAAAARTRLFSARCKIERFARPREIRARKVTVALSDREGALREQLSMLANYGSLSRAH